MLQALNYSTHAITSIISNMESTGEILQPTFRGIVDGLRQAEKFILPDNGDLLDTSSMRPEFFDLLRLPFPVVALELATPNAPDVTPQGMGTAPGTPDKLVILAGQLAPDIGIRFVTVAHWSAIDQWVPCDYIGEIDPRAVAEAIRNGQKGEARITIRSLAGEAMSLNALSEQAGWDVHVLMKFCCTVNCENVSAESIPAPEKLNKKRIANGKEPFYSCRVLTIPGHSGSGAKSDGTHASPRLHLRRGHLRRLPSTKVVWVRHCLVGNPDRGIAEKIYAVA